MCSSLSSSSHQYYLLVAVAFIVNSIFIIPTRVNCLRYSIKSSSFPHRIQKRKIECYEKNSNIDCDNEIKDRKLLFHVAPLQAYTNRHLRYFYRLLSKKAVLWTEMEKVEDLLSSDSACRRRLEHDESEHPLVLQLGGNNPQLLKQAVRLANKNNFDEINLNVGCPSIESGGGCFGASLMRQPLLTRQLMDSMAEETNTPLSVKCRIGAHKSMLPDGSLPLDSYESLHNFIEMVSSSGSVKHFVIHARSAILSGLSPAKNREIPQLRYDYVSRAIKDFPSLKITLNGGIRSNNDIDNHFYDDNDNKTNNNNNNYNNGLHGLMAGRWFLQRPLDLYHIDDNDNIKNYDKYISYASFSSFRSPSFSSHSSSLDIQKANHKENVINREKIIKNNKRNRNSKSEAVKKYCEYALNQIIVNRYSISDIITPLILVIEQLKDDYNKYYNIDSVDYNNDSINDNYTHANDRNSNDSINDYNNNDADNSNSSNNNNNKINNNNIPPEKMSEKEINEIFTAAWEGINLISNIDKDTDQDMIKNLDKSMNNNVDKVKNIGTSKIKINNIYDDSNDDIQSAPSFRKLLQILTQLNGKKVTNKIIRNRSENIMAS